ncbi:MAG: hypothetical protein ACAI25_15950, partial [Planctomycetota bacterium]
MRDLKWTGLFLAAAVAFLLGCGSEPTHADDQKPDEKQPAPAGDKKDDKGTDKPADPKGEKGGDKGAPAPAPDKVKKRFVAEVTDRFKTKPFKIDEAELLVPQVSLLGGESFDHKLVFVVKHGAAEIEVPFEEISKVTFELPKDDRLPIRIEFRGADKAGKVLDGTVKSNLQLGGKYEQRNLAAKLKLREIESITL